MTGIWPVSQDFRPLADWLVVFNEQPKGGDTE
jgi:hypothetical protein